MYSFMCYFGLGEGYRVNPLALRVIFSFLYTHVLLLLVLALHMLRSPQGSGSRTAVGAERPGNLRSKIFENSKKQHLTVNLPAIFDTSLLETYPLEPKRWPQIATHSSPQDKLELHKTWRGPAWTPAKHRWKRRPVHSQQHALLKQNSRSARHQTSSPPQVRPSGIPHSQ